MKQQNVTFAQFKNVAKSQFFSTHTADQKADIVSALLTYIDSCSTWYNATSRAKAVRYYYTFINI